MLLHGSAGAAALIATLMMTVPAAAFDDAKYPDWKGQWTRMPVPGYPGQPPHDPSKPPGLGQGAPLTPEYQAVLEANLADQKAGGQGGETATYACLPNGMPRMMTPYEPIEFIITPDTTYVLIEHIEHDRRIFTDGREWPAEVEPTFGGYSIGRWIDEDGDGRYDVLEVETRYLKDRAPTTRPEFRSTGMARPSSGSASISTNPTATSCTTRSPRSIMH